MSDDMNRTPDNPEDCEAQQRDARSADTWHTPPIVDGLVAALEELEQVDRTTAALATYGPIGNEDNVAFLIRLANIMDQTGLDHAKLSTIASAYGMSLHELLLVAEELTMLVAIIAQPILPPVSIAMYLLDDPSNEEPYGIDPNVLAWYTNRRTPGAWDESRSITSERSEQNPQTPPVIPLPIRSVEDNAPGPITFDPVTRPGGIGDIARQVNDQSRGVFDRLKVGLEERQRRLLGLQNNTFRPRHQIDADQADRLARRTADFREQPLTDFDPELLDPTTGRETAPQRAHLRLVNDDSCALPGSDPFQDYTKRMLRHSVALGALMALGNCQEKIAGTTDDTPKQNPEDPFDPAS